MTDDVVETIGRHPRLTIAVLIIALVAIGTAYLQSQKAINVFANLTEIWIFAVALPLLSLALALIIRHPRGEQKPAPIPPVSTTPTIPIGLSAGRTTVEVVKPIPLVPTTGPLVLSLKQFKYREEVRAELIRIHIPLALSYDAKLRKPIQFKSWNELREPNFHTLKHDLIAIKEQDEAIESFSTALNRISDNLWQPNFDELYDECITRYAAIRKTGFFNPDMAQQVPVATLEAQFRLEPPVGIENIPEPERSRIIAEVVPKNGAVRSQQLYVKAINGDLTNCEAKVSVDAIGFDHMLWEGIRRQPPANAKDRVTIHRDDEKYFTFWYAHQKDEKEYLYIPITTTPHMARQIDSKAPPLTVDVWLVADGFSDKRHRFIIYRESWQGILAKEIGEDGIPFAEFDALWHFTSEFQRGVVSFAPQGSDKASRLHISHRAKEIWLTGRMCNLIPFRNYQIEIAPSYTIDEVSQLDSIDYARTLFIANQNGEANWEVKLSADKLVEYGFERFSIWIIDMHSNLKVLVSDNISFHN